MKATLEVESTLTDRYQTTVPTPVRQALKLDKRDRVHYAIRPDGSVLLSRAAVRDAEDPVMSGFLDFLAEDMRAHPQRLQVMSNDLAARVRGLVQDVEVDLDAPLSAADE